MPTATPMILAIDTSCDDTSVAITQGTTVLSNVIASQTQLHKQYGGVFPTVAKQAHKENIDPTIKAALQRAHLQLADVNAIAVTQGPGLAPALEVGITRAKELATQLHIPLIAVNHIEGHLLSPLAQRQYSPTFPVLSIVVSGGHTEFILVKAIGQYEMFGQTVDDAAGECLDKVGRMLDLGYPAGPVVEGFARLGNPRAYVFPLPMTTTHDFNVSFSGIKTHSRNLIETLEAQKTLTKTDIYDLCASLQYAIFRHITYKLNKILQSHEIKEVWLGGGVAANTELRRTIRETIRPFKLSLKTPYNRKLCADNAAMIGIAAHFKYFRKEFVEDADHLDRQPRLSL